MTVILCYTLKLNYYSILKEYLQKFGYMATDDPNSGLDGVAGATPDRTKALR